MKPILFMIMAALCLTTTAHADSGSLRHKLNSNRWVKLQISEGEAGYKETFCAMLKGIGTGEKVQSSKPREVNDSN